MEITKDIMPMVGITMSLLTLVATVVVISQPLNIDLSDRVCIVMSLCILSGLSIGITARYADCDYGEYIIEDNIQNDEISKDEVSKDKVQQGETPNDEILNDEPVLAAQCDNKGVKFRDAVEVITITPNRSTSTSTEVNGENNIGDVRIGDEVMALDISNEKPETVIQQPKLVKCLLHYYDALK
ncbi:MAG TPA: hypothetical protein DEQ74_01640 [Wolbachia sp.]|jgi:hypothetical protein|uniref:hypothetical protein n=1 Tax=Wolbachia endosymbiont of Pentalonia nigronervosa TaxID=1301914 RepID=UPI000EEB549E|nr:hypothetical protein [Wolbachia endosymbiont of Pentalonia nigronervosa]MBD0391435.1 hypothetical protein [Wolbachia endosymbiont of Pentalonia nigronervosa]HCE59518.1 hypothetical protein [Wolbachia sp.]